MSTEMDSSLLEFNARNHNISTNNLNTTGYINRQQHMVSTSSPTMSTSGAESTPIFSSLDNFTSDTSEFELPSILEGVLAAFSLSDESSVSADGTDIPFFNDSRINETSINNGSSVNDFKSIRWTDITLASLFCCIIAGTVVGNTLVIAAVTTTRRLRTVTNCFVMSLAVADWLVGMFVMPPKVMLHLENNVWPFGTVCCQLWISLDILLCTASILSLCAISIDRYLAITRPLAYSRKRRSKRLALSMISCVWVAAAVITSPPILGWYDSTRRIEPTICEYNTNQGYVIYSALGSFFLPLLVMLYVYARIACVIARRQKTIQKLHNSSSEKKYFDSEEVVGDDMVHHFSGSTLNKHSSLNLSSSSLTFWGCMRLKQFTRRSKHDVQMKRGSNNSDATQPLQTSVPNPNTILSMSTNARHSTDSTNTNNTCTKTPSLSSSSSKNAKSNGSNNLAMATGTNGLDETCRGGVGGPGLSSATNLTRLRTGSRLCHHSLSNLSPQKSIVRRVQTSSSSRVSASSEYTENDLTSNRSNKLSRKELLGNTSSRIWTIEDEPDIEGIVKHASASHLTGMEADNTDESSLYGSHHQYPYINPSHHSSSLPPAKNVNESKHYNSISAGSGHQNNLKHYYPSSNSKSSGSPPSFAPVTSKTPTTRHHNQLHVPTTAAARSKSVKLSLNFHLNDQNQNNSSREFSSGRIASFKRETKTAQTLAAVVGGFIICWLPFFVVYVLAPFVEDGTFSDELMEIFTWLGWGNSAINPFIYAFYSADFRSAFWRLTFGKCEGLVRAARSPDRNSPKRYEEAQVHCQLRPCPP